MKTVNGAKIMQWIYHPILGFKILPSAPLYTLSLAANAATVTPAKSKGIPENDNARAT